MSKTVIHSRIPTDDMGDMLISPEYIDKFAEITKNQLGDEYILIITPFETSKIDGDATLININCKEYSYNELMDIIEKAKMYDGLNK